MNAEEKVLLTQYIDSIIQNQSHKNNRRFFVRLDYLAEEIRRSLPSNAVLAAVIAVYQPRGFSVRLSVDLIILDR